MNMVQSVKLVALPSFGKTYLGQDDSTVLLCFHVPISPSPISALSLMMDDDGREQQPFTCGHILEFLQRVRDVKHAFVESNFSESTVAIRRMTNNRINLEMADAVRDGDVLFIGFMETDFNNEVSVRMAMETSNRLGCDFCTMRLIHENREATVACPVEMPCGYPMVWDGASLVSWVDELVELYGLRVDRPWEVTFNTERLIEIKLSRDVGRGGGSIGDVWHGVEGSPSLLLQ